MKQPIIIQINKPIKDLHAIEHDINTRFPIFQFRDGTERIDLSNSTVRVYGVNNNLSSFFNDLEIINPKEGIAKLELTDTMMIEGKTQMQFVIMPNSGGQLKSLIFNLINGKSLVDSNAVEGSNEYKAFENALSKIDGYAGRLLSVENEISQANESLRELNSKYNAVNSDIENLKEKNDLIDKEIDLLKKSEKFDISKLNPTFYTVAVTAVRSVMQCMVIDEVTDIMYFSNVSASGGGGVPESYIISRVDKNGLLLDSMECEYGGHGTVFGLEREGGRVYIWSAWDKTDSDNIGIGNEVTRFPYQAGKKLKLTDNTVQKIPFLSGTYRRVITDEKNKLIGTITYSGTRYRIEVRNITDVKSGVDSIVYSYDIPDVVGFQGASIDNNILYWREGDNMAIKEPDKIFEFDMRAKKKINELTLTFGQYKDNKYEKDFREPEACFLYTDKITGDKSLFVPIVTGETGYRLNKIYAFHQGKNQEKFQSYIIESSQRYALTTGEGEVKAHPTVRKFSDFTEVGYYRFNTNECNAISDHPGVDNAGWFFENSPSHKGSVVQTLFRDGVSKTVMYKRFVGSNKSASPWLKFQN